MGIGKGLITSLAVLGMLAAAGRADTVALKNGDVITGTITHIDGQSVDLATEAAGAIRIKREGIKTLRSDALVTITGAGTNATERRVFVVPAEDGVGWHEANAAGRALEPK